MLDYIIVGAGLAGVSICAHLQRSNKRFKVISDEQAMASTVAGGIYNPVLLKRLTPTWKGHQFLDYALPFYQELERLLGEDFVEDTPILRRFASEAEQNYWFEAADRPALSRFLSTQLLSNRNTAVNAPLGYGQVLETGRIDVARLVKVYIGHLKAGDAYVNETFRFDRLQVKKDHVAYNDLRAKRMILAMGYRALNGPYFDYLPIQGNKGEILIIKAPELRVDEVIKATDFLIPIGDDLYKVGATYDRRDLSDEATNKARMRLVRQLEATITCPYEIMDQEWGIRPTVPDRRPLLGVHPAISKLAILNGLGSRGVLLAPLLANQLIEHIEDGIPLWQEVDIKRYQSFYDEAGGRANLGS